MRICHSGNSRCSNERRSCSYYRSVRTLHRLPPPCSPARSRLGPCRLSQRRIASAPAAALLIGPCSWPVHRICYSCFFLSSLFFCCLFHHKIHGCHKRLRPRHANARTLHARRSPYGPTRAPNFFNAARRVTDWGILLASLSNLLFTLFRSFRLSVGSWFLVSATPQLVTTIVAVDIIAAVAATALTVVAAL